jgi:hypothetical protein
MALAPQAALLARRAWRAAALSLAAAAVLASAGCGGAKDSDDGQGAPAAAAPSAAATDSGTPPEAAPAPAPVQPRSPQDSARAAIDDSISEARLFNRRLANMDSYASCMAKTKSADPPQRAVLEAACRHARGAPR